MGGMTYTDLTLRHTTSHARSRAAADGHQHAAESDALGSPNMHLPPPPTAATVGSGARS